jgi:hypothetical protein
MVWIPDILAGLAVLAGLFIAVAAAFKWVRFRRLVRDAAAVPLSDYTPRAAVIIPCKGVDDELAAGIRTLLEQEYPSYELLFVLESADDPAAAVVRAALDSAPPHPGRTRAEVVFAGPSTDCGQKVHNLRAGLERVSADVRLYAFIDSDCRPHPLWLRRLVAPLADPRIGAATGYRWYLPVRGGIASGLLSFWNSNSAVLLASPRRAFVWGGSMAIRRETFHAAKVLDRWAGSLADDYGVRGAVRRAGLGVGFVPQCLVLSPADMTLGQLWEFVCRQLIITRAYAAAFWRYAMIATAPLPAALAVLPAAPLLPEAPGPELRLAVLAGSGAVWALTLLHGVLRLSATRAAFPNEKAGRRKAALMYLLGTPLWAVFNLAALLKARWCRTIVWRGIKYVLLPGKKLIIERPSSAAEPMKRM